MNASSILIGVLALQASGGASMNGQTIDGEILDQRVTRCAIQIDAGPMTTIRPLIETSGNLRGTLSIKVVGKTGSNSNHTNQTTGFPGSSTIMIGPAAQLEIEMVGRADGREVCRLIQVVDLDGGTIRT